MAKGDMSDQNFADKVEWEGGLFEATFSYGLTAEYLADTDGELYQAMVAYDAWRKSGAEIIARVEAALPEIE